MARYLVIEGKGARTDIEYLTQYDMEPDTKFGNRIYAEFFPDSPIAGKKSIDSAETVLWRLVSRGLFADKYILCPALGFGNIDFLVTHLENREDTTEIVLCYDWYTNYETMSSLIQLRRKHRNLCREKGIEFTCIQRYTFEFAVLNFINLMEYAYSERVIVEDTNVRDLDRLHKQLLDIKHPELWSNNINLTSELLRLGFSISARDSRDTITFEQLASSVLYRCLDNTGFHTTKGSLGACWTTHCPNKQECIEYTFDRGYYECGLRECPYVSNKIIDLCIGSKVFNDILKL